MTSRFAIIERVDLASGRREKLRPAALQRSSGDRWPGIRLEHRRDGPGEVPEGYLLGHLIAVYLNVSSEELYWPGRGWKPQRHAPLNMQIFPAQVPHALRWKGPVEALVLEIAPEFLAAVAGGQGARGRPELRPFAAGEDRLVAHAILALREDMLTGSKGDHLYGENLGIALVGHVTRKYTDVKPDSLNRAALPKELLRRVLQYIGDNLETSLSLHDLAELIQMDVYRFLRSFKQSTGLPPHQYVLRERIERAKSLLRNPAVPLAEVALRSGFASQSHFATVFRRIVRVPPRAYRNMTS